MKKINFILASLILVSHSYALAADISPSCIKLTNLFLNDHNLGTWDSPAKGATKGNNSIYISGKISVSVREVEKQCEVQLDLVEKETSEWTNKTTTAYLDHGKFTSVFYEYRTVGLVSGWENAQIDADCKTSHYASFGGDWNGARKISKVKVFEEVTKACQHISGQP